MQRFYFKINLNKFGEEKKKAEIEQKTFIYYASSFIVITILLFITILIFHSSLNSKLQNRKDLLKEIKDEITAYKVSGEYLTSSDIKRIANISDNRIFWAKKLVALAERTTDKIAVTHFSFQNNILSLYGITKVDKKEKEFDLINNFIENLRNNKQINEDFPHIKFVKSSRDFEENVEILRFKIDCIHE